MKTLLFIVNPRAGRTRSMAPMFDVVARFSQAGYLIKLFITEGPGDAKRAAAELGGQFDLVVCAGGDGTLNETLCGLMTLPQRPPVGYIPHGSTNDFAASLHIPAQPMAAANAIAACAQPRRLDLGQHNGRYFAYVASSALSPAPPTPPRRRPKTRWAIWPTSSRVWAIWTRCGPTAAASRRTTRCLRTNIYSALYATPPHWAA